ncbi:MAG: ATP-binding protein [Chitinophagaceae bacterium]
MQTQNSNNIILLIIFTTAILLFLLSFIAAVLFLYQKRSILYYQQLEDAKNNYDKNLLQTQIEIQEQTFQNISREIHDNIGLSLTLAKLQLNIIESPQSNKIAKNVESSIDLISKAIHDLSDISKSLNSEAIKTHGLYNTLKVETEKIRRSGKYQVEFTEEGNPIFLDANKELILYRIAQEALNNIIKHASASNICIKLVYEKDFIRLYIEDDGIGFDKTAVGQCRAGEIHSGLTNIRNRTQTLNGNCCIKTQPGNGTSISITAPY